MSYSKEFRDLLAKIKIRRKCCKYAFTYGFTADSKNASDFIINRDIFVCQNCKRYFFRGLFLFAGNIADPKKTYHLEFVIFHKNLALDIKDIANSESIFLKYIKRRNRHVLYLKSSEQIEDFLYYIHAEKISFDLMETKILKDFRNNANRITNFENANLEKISKASAEQIEAVKSIIKKGGFNSLPDELKQTAKLRLKYIEMSIREIGEISNPPLSKSGITHRMERIIDIAKDLKDLKEGK
ncbi:MAG: DNA-binding protein WhiA [Oscillospiraceae bacterium]|nr:DNA-binding protein WhiA [Oscillospiraceae bacterium]